MSESDTPAKRFKVRLYEGGITSANQTPIEHIIIASSLQQAIHKTLKKFEGSILVYCAEAE